MPNWYRSLLVLSAVAIFAMGLVMIFNTTSAEVLDHFLARSTHQALIKQLTYALVGLCLAYGIYLIGYRPFLAWSPYLLVACSILLVAVLIPGVGRAVNGSRRWLVLGGWSFQPSEFLKYIVPAFFIYCRTRVTDDALTFKQFCIWMAALSIPLLLVLVEPNNGTAGVIGLLIAVMCLLTRVPMHYWSIPLFSLAFIGAVSAYHLPYVSARLKVYLHPEIDLKGRGHQPYQARIAAGSGGLLGRGPGKSLQKLSYLPEAQNDYIAAIFAEEFGFIGILMMISFYSAIVYVGFYIAYTAVDREGLYLAMAITFLFGFQTFMNLGVVSGLLPSTGLNLPLFSQGGTSLMTNIGGLGLLLSVGKAKQGGLS